MTETYQNDHIYISPYDLYGHMASSKFLRYDYVIHKRLRYRYVIAQTYLFWIELYR